MDLRRAKGKRGDWFARVDGDQEDLPCVHKFWVRPTKEDAQQRMRYRDPHAMPGNPTWDRFIEGIRTKGRVILADDPPIVPDGSGGFVRGRYIAVFEASEVEIDGTTLWFTFGDRLMDLR
ncbi:hypothetical protein [Inquilinus sp. OTU3971]|uniref:hypothetical protein n=1 Tax=Inquilinus sp. OTU3971 TaxID=3043855 RepID=UPI00313CD47E